MDLSSIKKPSLIIFEDRLLNNIKRIYNKAVDSRVIFRPHFKTHQSKSIGRIFRKHYNIEKITVSSVSMAKYFASDGWNDITLAFPVNCREIDDINELGTKITLNLMVDSFEIINFLEKKLSFTSEVYIKVDCGNRRVGIDVSDTEKILDFLKKLKNSRKLRFYGFLAHFGQTYNCREKEEIVSIWKREVKNLNKLKKLSSEYFDNVIISVGDTPSCSVVDDYSGVDEIRPGNFVFYDVMQCKIGSCILNDVALVVALPVVSKNYSRKEVIVYGGAVHLSKDFVVNNGNKIYGIPSILKNDNLIILEESFVSNLYQEHGIIKINDYKLLDEIEIGDLLFIFPVHSCLTVSLFDSYFGMSGEIYDIMKV